VHSGGNTSCAAKAGGSLSEGLTCWGDNSSGQATPPETVEGLSLNWWSTVWDWQDASNGSSKLALGETRSCGIMKTSNANLGGALVCWGSKGIEIYGSVVGYSQVTVHGDATCVVESSGIGYCWGEHGAKTEPETPAVVDAGAQSDAINEGLVAFRQVDASGNSCGSCHAPDGLDIVYHALPDDDFTRRTEKHVANQHVGPVVEMLNAHRDRYGWSPTVKPEDWQPMQPSASAISGETALSKDASFASALAEQGLLIATTTISTTSEAEAARDELLALDLHGLQVGIDFPLYSRDKTRGEAHVNANEWVPSLGHIAAPGKKYAFVALEDNYLKDPTTSNFLNLLQAYTSTSNPLVAANTTECGIETHGKCDSTTATTVVSGNLNSIERQRQMSMLIISHEMRMHMAGTSTGLFSGSIDYPVNAIWNTGVLAEQSGEACTAARTGFGGPWDSNAASKAACVRMPDPWNSEHDRSTCTHSGRCDFSKDLISFGIPWRWMGFMQNPALLTKGGDSVTSETTTAKKVQALTNRLTAAGYHTHGVLFLAKHRMARFFGTDQTWRGTTSDADLSAEFSAEFGMETPADVTGAHLSTHGLMVSNLRSMFSLLSSS
jgi:mono/diheme cytochrome c family protein